ncbi:MAG: MarR family transcriptional regulator, partial [Clostridia bacterium]|nr:MarR family transcriptional regulator [Clostridia bacterium]
MIFDEKDYLNLESQAEAPVIALASLLCKIYEENFAIDTDDKFLNQRATRFILAILSKKEGLNQHELTKISHLKGATISIALSHLEENDIIYRVPDRYDHRSFKVYLTPKGADINRTRMDIVHNMETLGKV